MMRGVVVALAFALGVSGAAAVTPSERLSDPALEERARTISAELRCLVCQNQSIDDSDADFAKDMRLLVRERLTAGDTDKQVVEYMVDRYGAFVRLRPPLNAATIALWGLPFVVALLAIVGVGLYLRGSRKGSGDQPQALTDDEEKALAAVLKKRG